MSEEIVPIYKKGERLDPSNHRGVVLINTLLKAIAARLQADFIIKEEGLSQVACLLDSCQRGIVGKDTIISDTKGG